MLYKFQTLALRSDYSPPKPKDLGYGMKQSTILSGSLARLKQESFTLNQLIKKQRLWLWNSREQFQDHIRLASFLSKTGEDLISLMSSPLQLELKLLTSNQDLAQSMEELISQLPVKISLMYQLIIQWWLVTHIVLSKNHLQLKSNVKLKKDYQSNPILRLSILWHQHWWSWGSVNTQTVISLMDVTSNSVTRPVELMAWHRYGWKIQNKKISLVIWLPSLDLVSILKFPFTRMATIQLELMISKTNRLLNSSQQEWVTHG